MNSEPQSQVTWDGTPCFENTWRMNKFANCCALILLTVGMNMPCLESLSMMTRIAVWLSESGNCSIKSIEIEFHGLSGIGSCLRNP